jgi:hypothetical protein
MFRKNQPLLSGFEWIVILFRGDGHLRPNPKLRNGSPKLRNASGL